MPRREEYWRRPALCRARSRAWYAANKERAHSRKRAYYRLHKDIIYAKDKIRRAIDTEYRERRRDLNFKSHLKKKYGITVAEYESTLKRQNGVCAICQRPEHVKNRGGRIKRLAVDHDHATGRIRGLLCHDCNICVGLLDANQITKAADYLARHKTVDARVKRMPRK